VIHLLRNSFRYASRKDWSALAKDLRRVYTAPTEAAALDRFAEFSEVWEARYPAIVKLWENAWAEFVPFLAFDPEIRSVIYTTNAIESLNAQVRKAVRVRGHFPSEEAAAKLIWLVLRNIQARWKNPPVFWQAAKAQLAIQFEDRFMVAD
jgi:transposase-like protein